MAGYVPPFKDGKHAALAGSGGFCYGCGQMCGGADAAGNPLICACCLSAGLSIPVPAASGGVIGPDEDVPPPVLDHVVPDPLYDPAWPDAPPEVAVP